MKNLRWMMAVAAAAMVLLAQEGQAGLIDNFDSPPQFVASVPGLNTNNAIAPLVLGGWRHLEASGSLANLTGTAGVFNGTLVYGNGPSGIGTLAVSYTSNNVGLGGGIGTNLMAGGATQFAIDVVEDDTIPTILNYRVEDVFGAVSTAFANIGGNAAGSTFVVPFASFAGAADFSVAKFLQMSIVGGANADITLDNLRTNNPVPEPSSMILAGLGLVGLVAYRRKRQSRN